LSQRSFYDLYPITAILLLLCGGFFALEVIGFRQAGVEPGQMLMLGGLPRHVAQAVTQVLIDLGASRAELIRDEHQYWRLLSAVFLHGGILHLLMNGSVLLNLGRICESQLSSTKFFTIYVLSGIGGSALPYFWRISQNLDQRMSVGASGALCGLIGMLLVFSIKEKKPALRASLTRWIIFMVLITLMMPGIDHLGHLGGFVVGGILGLTVKGYTTSREARLWRIPAWICGAMVVYSLGMAVWYNGQQNWNWRLPW
jgi:rhomboid protease GluP